MRRVVTAAAAAAAIILTAAPVAAQPSVNWPQYLYSAGHTSDNTAATIITPANAGKLARVWSFHPPTAPSGLAGFFSSPTVYNGAIYIGARNGYFYAINETTGTVIWSRFIGYVPKKTCGPEGFTSTATVAADPTSGQPTIYVYGATGDLYAMKASDGTDVFPPAVVAIPSTTKSDYYAWGSPLVSGGNIYIGISSQCDDPLVRAGLDEFSQASGSLEATFWTTPAKTRGASIWSTPATDGSSIYVTTGNGPSGSHGESILKLSPDLSTLQGSWQVPAAQQISDSDFGASPGIFTAGGTQMIGACNKNGDFYALATSNLAAGPVWQDKIGNTEDVGPGQCDAAPVFDGSSLYLASNGTTINGTAYDGSLRKVNPATGAYEWQTGLTGSLIGSPTADGAGVLAGASYGSTTSKNAVWVLNAATGKILKTISIPKSNTFAQPVFADNYLIFASTAQGLQAFKVPGT
jgi:outer membrane protein assembly factor BamB